MKLLIKCDICGKEEKAHLPVNADRFKDMLVKDLAAFFSYYRLPDQKLQCFDCAMKQLRRFD